MAALVLGIVALAAVVLSFAFALAVFVLALSRSPRADEHPLQPMPDGVADERGGSTGTGATETGATETGATEAMSRVLADVERLAALRERGALTDKEFATQKAKLFVAGRDAGRAPLPQRTR